MAGLIRAMPEKVDSTRANENARIPLPESVRF